jgi:hypothetical protein
VCVCTCNAVCAHLHCVYECHMWCSVGRCPEECVCVYTCVYTQAHVVSHKAAGGPCMLGQLSSDIGIRV